MQNPFETGHIKNYILLYASVVVIMILFFIASTLFNDVKHMNKKSFDNNNSKFKEMQKEKKLDKENNRNDKFKLLNSSY